MVRSHHVFDEIIIYYFDRVIDIKLVIYSLYVLNGWSLKKIFNFRQTPSIILTFSAGLKSKSIHYCFMKINCLSQKANAISLLNHYSVYGGIRDC
mmetsp:Transcript_907/g.739  ORF Transcript_907/g.739 Transcript_907/m.739 type:complete len:95 (+) Transcript_907:57-341(+)